MEDIPNMGIINALRTLWDTGDDAIGDAITDRIPYERQLATDRRKRADGLKKMMQNGEQIGEAAELMVQQLAETKSARQRAMEDAIAVRKAQQAAEAKGDTARAQEFALRANDLANDIAEADEDLLDLEQLALEGQRNFGLAKDMIVAQADQLQKLANSDARLVAKIRMTEMKGEMLKLQEVMYNLVPGDSSNIRGRIEDKAKRLEAKTNSRGQIVAALLEQQQRGMIAERARVTTAGSKLLDEIDAQIGYTPSQALPAPSDSTPTPSES